MTFKEYYLAHSQELSNEIGEIVKTELYDPKNKDIPPEAYVVIAKISEAIFIRSFQMFEKWQNESHK